LRVIFNENTDPHFNLALEENLFKKCSEEIFMLWQNRPSVIVGKNQNTHSEVDVIKAESEGIDIVRRETGGGAVYHDLGNLNYSFISNDPDGFMDFKRFAEPIFKTLEKLGIKAELSGRNDFVIDGRKFSGNAQSIYHSRLLHHGTLLFDTDTEVLSSLLTVDEEKIASKGISSVKSRVTNISEYLENKISVEEFKTMILKSAFEIPGAYVSDLSEEEISDAEKLKNEKYDTWDWNFGYAPPYTFHNKKYTSAGSVEVFLNVEEGIITAAKIYGDFFGTESVSEFEKKFVGIKHNYFEIKELILKENTKKFFSSLDGEELFKLFF